MNMDEQPNLREFLNEVSSFSEEQTPAATVKAKAQPLAAIGDVIEIAGSGSQIRMNGPALTALQTHNDPSVASSVLYQGSVNAVPMFRAPDREAASIDT